MRIPRVSRRAPGYTYIYFVCVQKKSSERLFPLFFWARQSRQRLGERSSLSLRAAGLQGDNSIFCTVVAISPFYFNFFGDCQRENGDLNDFADGHKVRVPPPPPPSSHPLFSGRRPSLKFCSVDTNTKCIKKCLILRSNSRSKASQRRLALFALGLCWADNNTHKHSSLSLSLYLCI
jgi:hypothetical protein